MSSQSQTHEGGPGPYPDELCQGVVDEGSAGQKEAAARAQLMEEEQLLVLQKEIRLLSTPAAPTVESV